ncbi:MAG: hypothetical protein V2A72_00895 [Candidatus Omnitrophota bacterium]
MFKVQNIYNYLSRLSKREKIIFYGAAIIISLALLDRLIINPILSKIKSLNEQIQDRQSGIKRNLHILSQKDKIGTKMQKYSTFFSKAESEEEAIASFLKEVEKIANKSSVYLVDMKPGKLELQEGAMRYVLNLNCEAQMEQMVDFMYNIESSDSLLTVEKYRITPKSKDSSLAVCSMTVSKTVIPK